MVEAYKPPQRRRLYLLRHAQVRYFSNAEEPDEAQLTCTGQEQARQVGLALQEQSFDRIFCSPVARCKHTLDILLSQRQQDYETVQDLREAQPAAMSTLSSEAIRDGLLTPFDSESFMAGEAFDDVLARADQALAQLLASPWETALVLAHEVVNRALIARVLQSDQQLFRFLEQDECCINILDFDAQGNGFLRLLNYCTYRPLAQGLRSRSMERVYADFQCHVNEQASIVEEDKQ